MEDNLKRDHTTCVIRWKSEYGYTKMTKILIADDDKAVRTSLSLLLKNGGYVPVSAENPDEALKLLESTDIELVVMDMNYSMKTTGEEGLQLLKDIKSLNAELPVIIITAWGSISLAVEGMKAGAADFINKPWNNEHFLQSVRTALSLSGRAGIVPDRDLNRRKLDELYDFSSIIGEEKSLLEVLSTAGRVAKTEAPVLIAGESGTGKELIAEAIHDNSGRADKPFVKVNLGGISQSLFESEMFGHKKGAFTDAKHDRIGRFGLAHKGTIFLDEIGELDLNSQVKLLRVLQDRTFEVLGSSETKTVDVRVISATNRSLEKMVEDGQFREDLFYRINLITLKVPPLRERKQDIPPLIDSFLANLRQSYPERKLIIERPAIEWLMDLPWSGNIRELKNLVERTMLVTDKTQLDVNDFQSQSQDRPKKNAGNALPAVGSMTLEEMELSMIKKALQFHDNNISQAAKSLGLSRSALYRRMEKYGVTE